MHEIVIESLDALEEGARQFIAAMEPGRVYAFRGSMGAGKTTLIAEVCRLLGVEDSVSSPTFSIVNEYDTADGLRIYHFDCYRIESEAEAYDMGAEDYLESGETCFVEWPDRLGSLLPEEAVDVEIEVRPDGGRVVRIGEQRVL